MEKQPEFDLSNPDQPREVPCDSTTFFQTLANLRSKGAHITDIKVGPQNAQ